MAVIEPAQINLAEKTGQNNPKSEGTSPKVTMKKESEIMASAFKIESHENEILAAERKRLKR